MWEIYKPPPIAEALMLHRKRVAAAITFQGGILEGYIKVPPYVIPKILPGHISSILVSGKYGDPPIYFTGPFQFLFGLLVQSCLGSPQLPLLPIHPPLLLRLAPLLHLSVVFLEIQCLSVEKLVSEDLTAVLLRLKVGECVLGGVWDPNSRPLHTPVDPLVERVSDLISPTP